MSLEAPTECRIAEAIGYVDRGWRLIPIDQHFKNKRPNLDVLSAVHGTTRWNPLSETPATEQQVRSWFDHDPHTNIGIITGKGMVVADFDQESTWMNISTPSVKTARGKHYYLSTNQNTPCKRTSWGDIKGDGGYVVAPPSVHATGVNYKWEVRPERSDLATIESFAEELKNNCPQLESTTTRDTEDYAHPIWTNWGQKSRDTLFDGTARFSTVDAAVEMALPVLGISAPLGKAFHCVIPGHDDKSPSASLYKDSLTGAWKYRDWHHAGKYEWLMLADVRAAQSAGRVVELGPSSALLWYRRLFWEAGVLKIADIQKVPLLHNARPTIRLVAEGFALLLAIKNIGNEEISSPYSAEFAAAWCGVTFDQARYSIRELKKMDVLRPVDVYRSPKDGVRKMYLYEIGKGKKS